jgi:hypothetical protein
VDQYTNSIYISEHSVKIRKTKFQFFPIYYTCIYRICIFKCPLSQEVSRNLNAWSTEGLSMIIEWVQMLNGSTDHVYIHGSELQAFTAL